MQVQYSGGDPTSQGTLQTQMITQPLRDAETAKEPGHDLVLEGLMVALIVSAALLTSPPAQEAGAVKANVKGGFDMVFVPGGDFQMGDTRSQV